MPSLTRLDNKQVFNISNKIDIIGRGSSATILLDDDSVSRNHAEIFMMSGCVEVIDLNSRNGIFVNDDRVKKAFLNEGDKLAIGNVELSYSSANSNLEKTISPNQNVVSTSLYTNMEDVEIRVNDIFLKHERSMLTEGQLESIVEVSLEVKKFQGKARLAVGIGNHLKELLTPDTIIIRYNNELVVESPAGASSNIDKDLFDKAEGNGSATLKRKIQASGKSILCSPILNPKRQAIGTVYIESGIKAYGAEELLYIRALLALTAPDTSESSSSSSAKIKREIRQSSAFSPEDLLILGKTDAINQLKKRINDLSNDKTVMISGPPGTDRLVIANNIHCMSDHSDKPFIHVDCSALNQAVLQEELFGRDGGLPLGKFKAAAGGTLFLNRLTCLPLDIQDLISVYIQSGTIIPMGTANAEKIDLQLIVGVRGRPEQAVQRGVLSNDLLPFFIGKRLHIPVLTDRKEDIPEIAGYYFNKFLKTYHKHGMELTKESEEKLSECSWPGNDRELQLVMEKAVLTCNQKELTPDFLALSQE